jgi:hypothetical protein
MNRYALTTVLISLIALAGGVFIGRMSSERSTTTAVKAYSNEFNLLELRQQANVLNSLIAGREPKANELLITRLQADLAYFETVVKEKDDSLDKPKACELLTSRVGPVVDAYSQREAEQSQLAKKHLTYLLQWCSGMG